MKLSIVICSYNREKYILDAMNSVKNQIIDSSFFELVVINNNSTDNTDVICRAFEKTKGNLQYTYVIEEKAGLSNARNCGIEHSKGEIITFIDDDAIAEPDFAANIINHFSKNPEIDALGGKVLPIFPNNMEPKWLSHYLNGLVTKVDFGDIVKPYSNKYPAGCNMSFRKIVFDELGGFNPNLVWRNDDKYIFLKLKNAHKKTLYTPDVVVHHNIDEYRLEKEFLDKLINFIGSSERVRLKGQQIELIKKPLEYTLKLGASFILALPFLLKGELVKASYLIYVRWKVLVSFFQKSAKY